jgi:transposase
MSLPRLVITAVTVEHRSKSAVAPDYGISRFWVQTLVKRFEAEGKAAFEPHSRRPHSNPRTISLEVEEEIVRLRKTLTRKGLDAGAETIAAHLKIAGGDPVPAVSTIWRILARRGLVNPQPQKRPRSSWRTFCADQPNERWQADITHWRLGDDSEVEILNILDDHSHRALARRTPAQAYAARPKAVPNGPIIPAHYRVRHDRIDRWGAVTLRHNSRLHHIGLGTRLAGTPISLLIDDLHIRVIECHTGQLIRELTLDPTRDYQPRGLPPGPPPRRATPRPASRSRPKVPPTAEVKAGRRPPAGPPP